MGKNCMTMFRKIPLYPKLISFGNNVWCASGVTFVTHDVIHKMLNNMTGKEDFSENIGCIDIRDNVFIGANTTILYNVSIGSNTIIAAGSVVNKSLKGGGVYAGVPARYICSIEDFMKKRKNAAQISVTYADDGLSDKTVKAAWKRFRENDEAKI